MGVRFKPGTKKAGYYFTVIVIVYWLCIRKRTITEKFETTINAVDPKTVWEFWADFSNYQKINPTITAFEIDYEKGTYENWEYGVSYWEHLTHLPFNVFLKGRYVVTPEQSRGHFTEPYRIVSANDACVSIFCTHVEADMTFTRVGKTKATKVTEVISMECAPLFVWYQRNEVRTQRQFIAEQLKNVDFAISK